MKQRQLLHACSKFPCRRGSHTHRYAVWFPLFLWVLGGMPFCELWVVWMWFVIRKLTLLVAMTSTHCMRVVCSCGRITNSGQPHLVPPHGLMQDRNIDQCARLVFLVIRPILAWNCGLEDAICRSWVAMKMMEMEKTRVHMHHAFPPPTKLPCRDAIRGLQCAAARTTFCSFLGGQGDRLSKCFSESLYVECKYMEV